MRRITALKQQKRDKTRVSVYLDDEFAFGLAAEVAAGLSTGQMLSEETIRELQGKEALASARQSAFRYLSYRPRSIEEVRRNLRRKEYDETLIEEVIAYLVDHEYLDDEAFATYWVEQREAFKPRSRLALRQELFQKGVSRRIAEGAVEEIDEYKAAEKAADRRLRRWAHLPHDEFRRKLGNHLRRRGFSYDVIRSTTEAMWQRLANETSQQEGDRK